MDFAPVCVHHGDVTDREDWPLGPALRAARTSAGLSVRAAAKRTEGAVSHGRWYQLESGYQLNKGQRIPIGTTASTVAAAARAVGWDPQRALEIAGFDPDDLYEPNEYTVVSKVRHHPMLKEGIPLDLVAETLSSMIDAILEAQETSREIASRVNLLTNLGRDVPNFPDPTELEQSVDSSGTTEMELLQHLRGQILKMIASANPSNANEVVDLFGPLLARLPSPSAQPRVNEGSTESPLPDVAGRMRGGSKNLHSPEGVGD